MANIRGIIVEIGGDTSKLQEALKKVNSSTASLSKELRGINSLLKLDPKNTELVSQKQTVLKQNIEETSNKLKALKEAQDRYIETGKDLNTAEYRNLQREIINTENKLKQLKLEASNWTQAGRSIEEFGNKVTNITNKVDKIGTTLTTSLTLPILGLATATVNSARKFESAFTGVEKTVDGTAEQMANLKQGIKDMSEVIPASTTEISEVAEAAGQLGIQTDNVLDFTKTMINMGNATNLSADEAATTLARFANVTRMSQSDFGRLGSVIVALGNNFATTEAEISAMGMNLASAGTQVGMSQSQIMALATALSSVGLEAQAGGTAFSKVMVNMQLAVEKGGKELKDFASVAGMSTKEFKKAFQEDATSAIMQFVDGLSKSGERGKSAIKILDDMGITETRLRDALLRSANASEVMSKAIDLGNKAWEENTALTNEADKRYQTLDSRMEMTKNKIANVATNTGNKLTPTFNKLLDKVDGLADKFNGLNEEETKNVIKTLAIVAAVGPAIKILGMLGNTTGTVIKGVGTLSQAVGVFTSGAKSANATANTLASGLPLISNPASAAVVAFAALTAAYLAYRSIAEAETRKVINEANEQNKAWKELQDTRNNMLSDSMAELSYYQKLKDELSTITDENGKVKDGYEKRADFILGELNKALGTEYELNGDIIESYQTLQGEIDNLIVKKKAEAALNAYQQEYNTAIKEQTTATQTLIKLQEQQAEALRKSHSERGIAAADAKREYEQLGKKIGEQTKLIADYGETTALYENLMQASATGSVEEINKALNDLTISYQQTKENVGKSVTEQVEHQTSSLQILKNNLAEAKSTNNQYLTDIFQAQIDNSNKRLAELENSLYEETKMVKTLTPEQIAAWKDIGEQDYRGYSEYISKMPEETRKQIENATGIVAVDTTLFNATSFLGENATNIFANSLKFDDTGKNEIRDLSNSIEADGTVSNAASILANNAENSFKNNANGSQWGTDLSANISNGMTSQKSQSWISNAASTVAGWISDFLHHTTPEKGPLKDDDKWMSDFIDNMASGILDNKSKVTNATAKMAQEMRNSLNIPLVQDFGKFQGSINNQIVDSTKTIFTTPQIVFNVQELDKDRLEQCFNYINRKFGSKY